MSDLLQSQRIRDLVVGELRREFDLIGSRLALARQGEEAELERLGALLPVAEQAQIPRSEVAKRAGVSRQTVLNLRNQGRGVRLDWPVDLRVVLRLGLYGTQSAEDLRSSLVYGPIREHDVIDSLRRLVADETIRVVGHGVSGGTDVVTYYALSPTGADGVAARLRQATIPAASRWGAYVRSTDEEAAAIAEAGQATLGEDTVVVIPKTTRADMDAPEVAFHVEARSQQEAESAAAARFIELRRRTGLGPRSEPVIVVALTPPVREG